jgi:hypothetical protein
MSEAYGSGGTAMILIQSRGEPSRGECRNQVYLRDRYQLILKTIPI